MRAIRHGRGKVTGTRPAPGRRRHRHTSHRTAAAGLAVARYTSSDARYAIDRADTITFQYPNGLQTQVVDRSIWVRLIIGPGTTTAPVNITLDSIRVANVSARFPASRRTDCAGPAPWRMASGSARSPRRRIMRWRSNWWATPSATWSRCCHRAVRRPGTDWTDTTDTTEQVAGQ